MPKPNPAPHHRVARPHHDALRASTGHHERDVSPYGSASVQERILQWQAQGVAALSPDALSVASVPRTDSRQSPPTSRPVTPTVVADDTPSKKDRAVASRQERRQRGRTSTPRKRVVSDEHWKEGRSQSVSQDDTAKAIPVSREEGPPKSNTRREMSQTKIEREERRRRRAAAAGKSRNPIRTKENTPEDFGAEPANADIESNVGHRTGYDSEREELSDASDTWGSLPDRQHDNMVINSRYAATLGRPPDYPLRSSLRMKGKMLNKTRAMLGISETAHTAPEFVTSIDAWLEEQPELYSDNAEPSSALKRNTRGRAPKDRRKRSERHQSLVEDKDTHEVKHDTDLAAVDMIHAKSATARLNRDAIKVNDSRRHTLPQLQQNSDVADEALAIPAAKSDFRDIDRSKPHGDRQLDVSTPSQGQVLLLPSIAQDKPIANEKDSACSLKRKLTTHEDLISELSRPGRSRRSHRRRATKTVEQSQEKVVIERVLSSVKEDNIRYTRELRTLVDGVIPVLLQCVLSKNDAMTTALLFSVGSEATSDHSVTKPIIDMGIALERLKSLHNRLPDNDVNKLFSWCQTAHRAYSDYLKAWRLGFQDIVVNLAPLEGHRDSNDIMAQDKNGDIVDADGGKVDVAYLLKRPLIKIRNLSKVLGELAEVLKDHVIAQKISEDYVELTTQAKRKHQQEQGRLEDEAAAQIDTTKTRDIRSLASLPGVTIERGYRVRARDVFNLTLQHSTGQRIDCKVELILRDSVVGDATGGDVLICQVEATGKWLLFPPIALTDISARKDESGYDLVVMIRGYAAFHTQWHELLALQAEESDAVTDWMNMLGSNPLPPKLNIPSDISAFENSPPEPQAEESQLLTSAALAQIAALDDVDVPLGEPSAIGTQTNDSKRKMVVEKPLPKLSLGGGLQQKTLPQRWLQQSIVPQRKPVASSISPSKQRTVASPYTSAIPENRKSLHIAKKGSHQPEASPRSSRPNMIAEEEHQPQPSVLESTIVSDSSSYLTSYTNHQSLSSATSAATSEPVTRKSKHVSLLLPEDQMSSRGDHRRSASTAVGKPDATSVKATGSPSRKSFSSSPLTDSLREKWAAMSGWGKKPNLQVNALDNVVDPSGDTSLNIPPPPAHKERSSLPALTNPLMPKVTPVAQANETTRDATLPQLPDRTRSLPALDSQPHSPFKLEYAASTATGTPDEYDSDSSEDSFSSDTSAEVDSELKDDLRSLPDMKRARPTSRPPPVWKTAPSTTGSHTLAPSDSASQGPYRSVPSSSSYPQQNKDWCKALICAWSDSGSWEPLRDEECAVLVSPGLIEAFPLHHMHSQHDLKSPPLVAFELTPIVPLRKGTALDITIRSPPTANSEIKTTNNVMFRSRSLQDCEKLYHFINWARCNNPTYIQLERARPRPQPTVTFAAQQSERPKSWFSFGGPQRRNSYRAGSTPPSVADSAMTSGSVSNALTALKRLSRSSAFSINRSSVIRRPGRASNQSLYSSDTNTNSGSGSSFPAPPTQLGFLPGKDGPNVPETSAEAVNGGGMVNNMKIKLFLRQGQDWKPLGPCRLSVLPAPATKTTDASRPGSSAGDGAEIQGDVGGTRRYSSMPNTPRREYRLPSSNHTPHRVHGNGREKRILVTQKDRSDLVLLDEVLGESCFEKVAERGIAVKVWTENEAMRNQGGVLTGRGRLYMMQFGVQSEASWVFGLCGTYRYGISNED